MLDNMLNDMIQKHTGKITRFEVIDHRDHLPFEEQGRVLVVNNCQLTISIQDEGRTAKVFLGSRKEKD